MWDEDLEESVPMFEQKAVEFREFIQDLGRDISPDAKFIIKEDSIYDYRYFQDRLEELEAKLTPEGLEREISRCETDLSVSFSIEQMKGIVKREKERIKKQATKADEYYVKEESSFIFEIHINNEDKTGEINERIEEKLRDLNCQEWKKEDINTPVDQGRKILHTIVYEIKFRND